MMPDTQASAPPEVYRKNSLTHRIRLRVAELAVERGIVVTSGAAKGQPNVNALAIGTGLGYQTLWPIIKRPEKVAGLDFSTIVKLCVFFNCFPGDLMVLEPAGAMPEKTLSDRYLEEGMTINDADDGEIALRGW